jgi:hypothetical protein
MISGTVVCSSFKQELFKKIHDFQADQFWLALYDVTASLDANTTNYTLAGEVTGIGYTAGGQLLTNPQVLLDPASRIAYATFADAQWDNSVIVARAALLYNATAQQRAVAVLDFGVDRVSNHGPFHVVFPPAGPSTALIRIF